MNLFDATHLAESSFRRSAPSEVDEANATGEPVIRDPEMLVQHGRPIVANFARPGRMGLGTLLAPADPFVIVDGLAYRLDPTVAASRVSPLERVHCATVVDFRDGSRSRIERPVPDADVVRLATEALGALPRLVGVQLSGAFNCVAVPNGTFGRIDGVVVGFVRSTSAGPDRHLSFVTADRTLGGPIREISIDNAELTIVAPRVVYLAGTAEPASTSPGALPRDRSHGG